MEPSKPDKNSTNMAAMRKESNKERYKIYLLGFQVRKNEPPIQWVPGIRRPGRGVDHSPPSSKKGKEDKAVPLQAWSGPEVSRKLRFPDFMTTAQDLGKVVSLMHRLPLPPRKYTWYSFLLEAESTPGP